MTTRKQKLSKATVTKLTHLAVSGYVGPLPPGEPLPDIMGWLTAALRTPDAAPGRAAA